MRASSPALAHQQRRLAVPRPTPRSREPRPTLRSVDLEVIADGAQALRPSTVPPPLPVRARRSREPVPMPMPRASHPEIIDAVVGAMRDLAFFETPVEAASFALVTALRVLPSLAGLALLRDVAGGGYVVVYARGPRSYEVVRARVPDDDPSVAAAVAARGPATVEYSSDCPAPPRHAQFGEPWSAVVTPVLEAGRCIGLIELVDPFGGQAPGASARQALAATAQHLSGFVRGREIVVSNAFAPEQVGLGD